MSTPLTKLCEPVDVKNLDKAIVARVGGFRNTETNEYLVIADSSSPSSLDQMQVRQAAYDLRIAMNLHNAGIEPRVGPYRIDAADESEVPALLDGPIIHRRIFRLNAMI